MKVYLLEVLIEDDQHPRRELAAKGSAADSLARFGHSSFRMIAHNSGSILRRLT
jgi:hypothetical protein